MFEFFAIHDEQIARPSFSPARNRHPMKVSESIFSAKLMQPRLVFRREALVADVGSERDQEVHPNSTSNTFSYAVLPSAILSRSFRNEQ